MNIIDYEIGLRLYHAGIPFHALLTALMLKADSQNVRKLTDAFPEEMDILTLRYDAPGGVLKDELPTVSQQQEFPERVRSVVKDYLSRIKIGD